MWLCTDVPLNTPLTLCCRDASSRTQKGKAGSYFQLPTFLNSLDVFSCKPQLNELNKYGPIILKHRLVFFKGNIISILREQNQWALATQRLKENCDVYWWGNNCSNCSLPGFYELCIKKRQKNGLKAWANGHPFKNVDVPSCLTDWYLNIKKGMSSFFYLICIITFVLLFTSLSC